MGEAVLTSEGPFQFFQVPYTALTMILTPSPRERDSATAYREYGSVFRLGAAVLQTYS